MVINAKLQRKGWILLFRHCQIVKGTFTALYIKYVPLLIKDPKVPFTCVTSGILMKTFRFLYISVHSIKKIPNELKLIQKQEA